jgi:hypothetical protein
MVLTGWAQLLACEGHLPLADFPLLIPANSRMADHPTGTEGNACEPLTRTARAVREQGDGLLHLFYVRQRPTFVEVRFERAIKSEQGKPCLAGHGRNPVLLETFRRGRREVNVHRAVTVFREIRKTRRTIHNLLFVLDEAARVQVIERNRPELLGGRIWRNMQTVGPWNVASLESRPSH